MVAPNVKVLLFSPVKSTNALITDIKESVVRLVLADRYNPALSSPFTVRLVIPLHFENIGFIEISWDVYDGMFNVTSVNLQTY